MDENSNGMINPLTPKPENVEPIQPMPEENLVHPTPAKPVVSEPPVMPAEPVASVESIAPTQPVAPQPIMQQSATPIEPMGTTAPVPPKKKNTSMIIAIILGVIAVGCAIAAILMFTVFKPTGGGSSSGGSSTGGTDTPTNTVSTIDSCPGCVFAYSNTMNAIVYSPNYTSKQYKGLSPDEYKTDWRDVIEETGHNVFLGLVLDEENRPNRAFACLKLEDSDPFCLEGLYSGEGGSSAIERSEVIKKNVDLINNAFSINSEPNYETGITYQQIHGKSQAVVELESSSEKGTVTTYDEDWVFCSVNYYGAAGCSDYWTK